MEADTRPRRLSLPQAGPAEEAEADPERVDGPGKCVERGADL